APAPAPAPAPAAPAPVRHLRPLPTQQAPAEYYRAHQAREDAARDERRRSSVCQVVRSLGTPLLVRYDATAGTCEALDTSVRREEQRCPRKATHGVLFTSDMTGQVIAYACATHSRALAALTTVSPYVTAAAHPLPGPRPL
ncbi:hypothetical protein JHN49_44130, partial [Streptomyces sp. MBT57]|nr:hypothetical protein [Streptomyces sp. MBT57]